MNLNIDESERLEETNTGSEKPWSGNLSSRAMSDTKALSRVEHCRGRRDPSVFNRKTPCLLGALPDR
jgi:hypothetical protein